MGSTGQDLRQGEYDAALEDFLRRNVTRSGAAGTVQAYHAVRNMPYFSGPDRTPLAALHSGRGACTAKHLILRDALRRLGMDASVELVEGDFAASLPVAETMPEDLKTFIREGVRDFHCWVRLGGDGPVLDATWPDSLEALGFPVNSEWDGRGDTRPALAGGAVRAREEDVLARKEELLAGLSQEEAARRRVFLGILSQWLRTLP